ncbi:MAG: DUF3592 domain-containing protein [Geminicoccales bacterium]
MLSFRKPGKPRPPTRARADAIEDEPHRSAASSTPTSRETTCSRPLSSRGPGRDQQQQKCQQHPERDQDQDRDAQPPALGVGDQQDTRHRPGKPCAHLNALSIFAPQAPLPPASAGTCGAADRFTSTLGPQRATGMSQGASSIFAAALIIAALIFLAFGGHAYLTERRYAREAQVASGTVLADSRQVTRSSSATTFETPYRFTLPDGQVIEGEDVIDARFFEGARVSIEYLPGRPSQSRIEAAGPAYRKRMWLFLGLGATFLLVGIYLTAYNLRQG